MRIIVRNKLIYTTISTLNVATIHHKHHPINKFNIAQCTRIHRQFTTQTLSSSTVKIPDRIKSMNISAIKSNNKTNRFYMHVNVISTNNIAHLPHSFIEDVPCDQYAIMLDSHFLTTPNNRLFTVPTEQLATLIAIEWDLQTHRINIDIMPITHICMIANDQAIEQQFIQHFNNYIKFDSICIRALTPTPLVRLQHKLFDPLIDRMNKQHNIQLNVSHGIMTPNQSDLVYARVHSLLHGQSPLALACIDSIAAVSKSFVIGWMMYTRQLSIDQAYKAARLDEDYQIGQYGMIDGAFGHAVEMTYVKMRIAATQSILNTANIIPNINQQTNVKIQPQIDLSGDAVQSTAL